MAPWVMLAVTSDELSLNFKEPHGKRRTDSNKLSSDYYSVIRQSDTHTHTLKTKYLKSFPKD